MGILDISNGSSHLHGVYAAVPAGLDLEGLLSNIDGLKGKIFDFDATPKHIEGHKALVEHDGTFTDTTITYSRRPFFDPRLYNLPTSLNLEGRTTLNVTALGPSEPTTQTIVHQILEQFPDSIDLEFKPEFLLALQNGGMGMVNQFSFTTPFFDRYLELRRMLKDIRDMETKKLSYGGLIGLVRESISKMRKIYSPEQHHFRLVRSVEGSYNGQYARLSLLYFNSPAESGTYGVILLSKADQRCEECTQQFCDMSRSYVGYIFSPQNIVVGGTILLTDENRYLLARLGFTPDNKISTHTNGYEVMSPDTPLEVVERKIDELKLQVKFSGQHVVELKSLAGLLYAARKPSK